MPLPRQVGRAMASGPSGRGMTKDRCPGIVQSGSRIMIAFAAKRSTNMITAQGCRGHRPKRIARFARSCVGSAVSPEARRHCPGLLAPEMASSTRLGRRCRLCDSVDAPAWVGNSRWMSGRVNPPVAPCRAHGAQRRPGSFIDIRPASSHRRAARARQLHAASRVHR